MEPDQTNQNKQKEEERGSKNILDISDSICGLEGQAIERSRSQGLAFESLFQGKYSSLEVRDFKDSQRMELRFSIYDSANPQAAVDELNSQLFNLQHYPQGEWQNLQLSQVATRTENGWDFMNRDDLTGHDYPMTIILDFQPQKYKPTVDYESLLAKHDLKPIPNSALQLIMYQFRVAKGFPEDWNLIGTPNDVGDLARGGIFLSDDGSVMTKTNGIGGVPWEPSRSKSLNLYLAGRKESIESGG